MPATSGPAAADIIGVAARPPRHGKQHTPCPNEDTWQRAGGITTRPEGHRVKTVLDVAIPLITFLLLTAVGLDLTVPNLLAVRRQPRLLAIGLLVPLAVLPFVALASIALVGPPAAIATSLLLLAARPIGGISNMYSYLARASTALSVTLTGVSCLLATVTIPMLTKVFEVALRRPLGFRVSPGVLLVQLVVMLAMPISVGMGVRSRWPQFAVERRGAIQRAGCRRTGLARGIRHLERGGRLRCRPVADGPAGDGVRHAVVRAGMDGRACRASEPPDRFDVGGGVLDEKTRRLPRRSRSRCCTELILPCSRPRTSSLNFR